MVNVYAAKLENEKYYIGCISDPLVINGRKKLKINSNWTKRHKPLSIIESYEESIISKTYLTRIYMKKYGIQNVRGGGYCNIELSAANILSIQRNLDLVTNEMSMMEKINTWYFEEEKHRNNNFHMHRNNELSEDDVDDILFLLESECRDLMSNLHTNEMSNFFDNVIPRNTFRPIVRQLSSNTCVSPVGKEISCPMCRGIYYVDSKTVKIKGQEQNCCICYSNKAEILCDKCHTVNICNECCTKL